MNKKLFAALIIALSISATGCGSKTIDTSSTNSTDASSTFTADAKEKESSDITTSENNNSIDTKAEPVEETKYETIKKTFTEGKITITYPEVTGLKDTNKQQAINELIKNEIIQIKNQLTSPSHEPSDDPSIEIDYKISLCNANMLSIQYSGIFLAPKVAHPSMLFYTTNVNINSASKVRLSDVITIDKNLIQKFREGTINLNEEKRLAVTEYINSQFNSGALSDDKLINKFSSLADDSTKEYPSEVNSYFTENSIGISIQIPHAIGDHAEFEIKYSDIHENIKHENDLWKGLLK